MALEDKSIDSIQFGDIEQLVANQVEESITLDYKEQMPEKKKDFLADVVAMLNTDLPKSSPTGTWSRSRYYGPFLTPSGILQDIRETSSTMRMRYGRAAKKT